ncbi:hypothetical protein CYMTET_44962 [Cymbomonas tetramitiformis]|uniref:Uncharacterized protein n=1 Tax=Cymbomonas tetramitiformis TaxID=36881 RepID=A0AAE0C187_9CHLO|nr:hypothetical protein CYMTET_44962 [Cymbomonas tetramitiformis]
MLSACMPAELVAHVTGHEMGTSAMWEYLDPSRALCIPGATVLAGWPAFPWGQHGMGPSPPSLDAIISPLLHMEKLEGIVDKVFRLDNATNPAHWKGGELRPLLHAAFASGVMYFEERTKAGEMPRVQVVLMEAVHSSGVEGGDARSTLIEWGNMIRAKFTIDNLHLTSNGPQVL